MSRELTVASVRGTDEAAHVEVLFLESARVYLLERARPDFGLLLDRLHEGQRVRIATTVPDGEVIDDVEALSA